MLVVIRVIIYLLALFILALGYQIVTGSSIFRGLMSVNIDESNHIEYSPRTHTSCKDNSVTKRFCLGEGDDDDE